MPILDFVHNVKLDIQNLCENMLLLIWFSNWIDYLDASGLDCWESLVSGIFTAELCIILVMLVHSSVRMLQFQNWSQFHSVWYWGLLSALANLGWNQTVSVLGIVHDHICAAVCILGIIGMSLDKHMSEWNVLPKEATHFMSTYDFETDRNEWMCQNWCAVEMFLDLFTFVRVMVLVVGRIEHLFN